MDLFGIFAGLRRLTAAVNRLTDTTDEINRLGELAGGRLAWIVARGVEEVINKMESMMAMERRA